MTLPKRAVSFVFTLCMTLMWVDVIHAQEANEEDLERAVILFEESETAYNEGRFADAAAMLRRAYALHADPLLLFNLARALEGEGDLDGAIEGYEQYLSEAPDAEDRGAIEARLRTLRTQREQLASAEEEPVEEEPTEPLEEAEDEAPPVAIAPWLTAAGGLAIVGVGGIFGAMSQSKATDAANEPVQETAQSLHDQASTFATLANVFFVVGGLVAAGGVAWGIINLLGDDDEGEPDADIAFVPGGVVLDGRF